MLSFVLVIAVTVIRGVTRLTESGLSVTERRPITGVLLPFSQALVEWESEFDKYKSTPEFCCTPYFIYTSQSVLSTNTSCNAD